MTLRPLLRLAAAAAASLALATPALAAIAYSESGSGDLSNNRLAPTAINFALGANDVLGATGILDDDLGNEFLDYGKFIVPTNSVLSSITVLAGTEGAEGGLLFFGLQAGATITLPPTAISPAGLLGWNHFDQSAVGTSLLEGEFPIGAGTYSFWIQDFNDGPAPYGLRFNLTALPVPEPQTYAMLGIGLALLGLQQARRLSRA